MEGDERVGLSVTQSSHILGWDADSSAGAEGGAVEAAAGVSTGAPFWASS